MECRLETITPKKAAKYLEKNTYNRPLKEKHINSLADAITRGEWRVTGDSVKFNGEMLIDGQHRLHAVLKSGVAIQTYVARGLEADAYGVIDQGRLRTVGDHFGRAGEAHYTTMAAAVRFVFCYENGGNFRIQQTPIQAEAILAARPTLRDSVHFVRTFKVRGLVGYGAAAGMHNLMAEKDSELAAKFWEGVITGENLTKAMPAYLLRDRMLENSKGHSQVRPYVIFAMAIKAWNLTRAGKTAKFLRWSDGANEAFPIIE